MLPPGKGTIEVSAKRISWSEVATMKKVLGKVKLEGKKQIMITVPRSRYL